MIGLGSDKKKSPLHAWGNQRLQPESSKRSQKSNVSERPEQEPSERTDKCLQFNNWSGSCVCCPSNKDIWDVDCWHCWSTLGGFDPLNRSMNKFNRKNVGYLLTWLSGFQIRVVTHAPLTSLIGFTSSVFRLPKCFSHPYRSIHNYQQWGRGTPFQQVWG